MADTVFISQLLPQLFANRQQGDSLTVFDAGLASPASVTFLSDYRCKLHFMDLCGEPLVALQHSDLPDAELRALLLAEFRKLFSFPAGTQFDLCLFWDALNHLNGPALGALCTALRPYLGAETLGHGFGIHKPSAEVAPRSYGIRAADQIAVRARCGAAARYPHRQGELNKLLPGFEVARGTLLGDGKLEFLLKIPLASQ